MIKVYPKDGIRVLVVEDDLEVRADLREYIDRDPIFELCGETGGETEGLKLLRALLPDVLILDLELEEGNGIDFATQMREYDIRQPFTLILTNNSSAFIHGYLHTDLKVDFIIEKSNPSYTPKMLLSIAAKSFKYFHSTSSSEDVKATVYLKNRIQKELEQMGFDLNMSGTSYIVDALLLLSKNPNLRVSKHLYPAIAKQNNNSATNVEKAIRGAIENTWDHAAITDLFNHYPYETNNPNGRPSNGEFLSNMERQLFNK